MSAPRTERLAEQIRAEASHIIARDVKDPGLGFITLTRVRVSPDLQVARIFYTTLGDQTARQATDKALRRVAPFLRRQLGQRLRLRRVPELQFTFDQSIAHQARVEELLQEIQPSSKPDSDDASDTGPDDHS